MTLLNGILVFAALLVLVGAVSRIFVAPLSTGEKVVIGCFGIGGILICVASVASYFV